MTSHVAGPAFTSPDSDLEADLEVDQLDSDSEINEDPPTVNEELINDDVATTHPHRTKPGERLLGHSLLSASRVENMIQADGVTGSMTLSKEALFVLSIATEDFIKTFVQAGHREASAHRRNQINYLDMAGATRQYQEFMFLGDTVPSPMSLVDALMLRQDKERELHEDNPALAHLSPFPAWITPIPENPESMEYEVPKTKKIRNANGKDHARRNMADINGQRPSPTMEAETPESYALGLSTHPLSTTMLPPYINGTQGSLFEEPINASSPHLPVHYPGAHSPPYHGEDDPQWSGPAPSGSTSGIVRESAPPFSPSQNTGRTIYTQSDSS